MRALSAAVCGWIVAAAGLAHAGPVVSTFTLGNGMQVVVIPDARVPVVTHMVYYRTGAGEDPWGRSGVAHFLEHLMFKSSKTLKTGEFTRTITRLGGRDNAFTMHDLTYYFQRVAREHLRAVMALEAERMANLRLVEDEVRTERDVVRQERRSTVEANPLLVLSEQMMASLYLNHPYGRPVIGWAHEIEKLSREDAAAFYRRYYAPNNAVLVVAGDVDVAGVRALAQATYGAVKPNAAAGRRSRPEEPAALVARRVTYEDARAGPPTLLRFYQAPSLAAGKPGDAEAIELLTHILGGDDSSRLYRRLVATDLAATAGASYQSNGLDGGRISLVLIPLPALSLSKGEEILDEVLAEVRLKGVTQHELERAKSALEARFVFESDNQMTLARRYGEGVALGRTIADLDAHPRRIQQVSVEEIGRVAQAYLSPQRSVTGTLARPTAVASSDREDKKP